jgi:hypothetical protein
VEAARKIEEVAGLLSMLRPLCKRPGRLTAAEQHILMETVGEASQVLHAAWTTPAGGRASTSDRSEEGVSPMAETAKCRSCGAAIRWVVVAGSGKRMPLDAEPSERGNVRVAGNGEAHILDAVFAADARSAGVPLFLSHFATCPEAAQHRRGK